MSMKQKFSKNKLLVFGTSLVLLVMLVAGGLKDTPPPSDVNFETEPPIATTMWVQQLKEPSETGNILFMAALPRETKVDKFLTVFVNDGREKIEFHDDGRDGDEKAGDFVFSAIANEQVDAFRSSVKEFEERLRLGKGTLVAFRNRVGTVAVTDRLFDMEGFDNFRRVELSRSIFDLLPGPKGGSGSPCAPVIERSKSLMITDISVTEDPVRTFNPCTGSGNPDGAWTFKALMSNIANTGSTNVTVDSLTREWLGTFLISQTVNGQALERREHLINIGGSNVTSNIFTTIIRPWLITASGNPGLVVTETGVNNWRTVWRNLVTNGVDVMQFAPFKLTAIVNRVDLRGNTHYGGGVSNAGEGRFVMSAVNLDGACDDPLVVDPGSPFAGFNIIFEYGIPISSCGALKNYQQQWRALSDLPFGSAFNDALQLVTDVFTAAGAGGARPNGSALNQLRSNEIAISSVKQLQAGNANSNRAFWQLREFNVSDKPGINLHRLVNVTTKQEPRSTFNGAVLNNGGFDFNATNTNVNVGRMAEWINNNSTAIRSTNYSVPDSILPAGLLNKIPFLAGRSDVNSPSATSTNHHWNGRGAAGSSTFITDDSARFVFSVNTCSGCHGAETRTVFGHIRYVGFGHNITTTSFSGGVRDMSSFLTGLGADNLVGDNDNDPNGLFFVNDAAARPTGAPTKRGFNDLLLREQSMINLLCNSCGRGSLLIELAEAFTLKPASKTH